LGGLADSNTLILFPVEEVVQPHLIPMEVNLEGWPLFSRQKRRPKAGQLEVVQNVVTEAGDRVEQLWRATATVDFSLPGPFDEDVFVGVMALVKRRGGMPKDGKIRFSIYELIKVLGKTKRSGFDAKVRESLDRIGSTVYYSKNAFYVAESQSLDTYRFTLWTVHFSKAQSRDGRGAEHHTLKFDDVIIRSYNSGYLKLLDTDLYLRLRIPLAKALYRLVDTRRHGATSWSVDARHLRDLLVMSRSYESSSKIWEVLQPALGALRREKFFESATLNGNTARFRIHPKYARSWYPKQASEEGAPPQVLEQQAVAALKRHGVWPARARKLVECFGPEKALHAIDVFVVTGSHRALHNRGAYVAEMVEKGDAQELAEMAEFLDAQCKRVDLKEENPRSQPSLITTAGAVAQGQIPLPPLEPDPAAQEVMAQVVKELEGEIDVSSLRVWFQGIVAVALKGGTLTISVPNSVAKEYIETRFRDKLVGRLNEHVGEEADLKVIVGERA
jgi:hypothetical protein